MIWLVRIPVVLTLLVTLLPFISTGFWFVRGWDFPRLQIALLAVPLLLATAVLAVRSESKWEPAVWSGVVACVLLWQISHVIPFSPVWPYEVPPARNTSGLTKLMVVNLKIENDSYAAVTRQIREEAPDVLLLIEVNDAWLKGFEDLRGDFQHHHEEPREEGLGMALYTNLKPRNMRTRRLVSDRRVSIWATLELPSGAPVNFIGVHPTPPGLLDSTGEERRDSRVRDAELLLIAREVSERSNESWIVAGDYNDVAWSHTTRLFKRTSGLRDPRIGRSFMGTFHSEYPLCRFPIDHVMLSGGFRVGNLSRKQIAGSDHFAVITTLELPSAHRSERGVEPAPQGNDIADAAELIEEGKEDAENRDVAAPE